MKKVIFYISFLLINILIFEFVLSIFDPEIILTKSFDKKYLFRFYKNRSGITVAEEYKSHVQINDTHFRQTIGSIQSYNGIILGDSFSEGWGVEESEIYTTLLNQKLTEGFRFLNLGMHGSSPILFAYQLKHYIQDYSPQKVIIQLFDNDLDDNEKLESLFTFDSAGNVTGIVDRSSMFGETLYNGLKESTLYRIIGKIYKKTTGSPSPILYYKNNKIPSTPILSHSESIAKFGGLKPLSLDINKKYNNQFGFYKDTQELKWKERLRKNEIYLKQIIHECKSKNVQLTFLYIPAKEFFAQGGILADISERKEKLYSQRNPFYVQLKNLCDKEGLNCIYVNELFFDKNAENLYFPYDAHFNREGHKALAEEIWKKYKDWVL